MDGVQIFYITRPIIFCHVDNVLFPKQITKRKKKTERRQFISSLGKTKKKEQIMLTASTITATISTSYIASTLNEL